MRDRFVTWGSSEGQRRLFTFELDAEDAQIIRRILPAEDSSDDLLQTILNAWNNQATMNYPPETEKQVVELTASGTIVPDGADVDDKVRVASAEREWPFDVVSARLRKQFQAELEELQDVIHGLEKFDDAVFERLKGAWNKVQTEINNKVLRYEHTHSLRKLSDELFNRIKVLRRGKEKEVRSKSKELKKEFRAKLAAAQAKLEEKKDLRGLFNELKVVQQEVFKASLSRDDRNALKKSIDELFKATKSEINASGEDAGALTKQRQGLEKRIQGLAHAIKRMKYSVERDNKDKFYENRRAQRANSQLAEQLAAAKLLMIGERSDSKQTKLDDMIETEAKLKKRLEKLIKREQKAIERRKQGSAPEGAVPEASSDGKPKTSKKRQRSTVIKHAMIANAAAAIEIVKEEE